MNAPEKRRRRVLGGHQVIYEGGSIIMRRIVERACFRGVLAEVRKHLPRPRKGESIVRELAASRLRGGKV